MSLSQAKNRVLKAIGIAKETELQCTSASTTWPANVDLLKEEIAAAGLQSSRG